MQNMNIIATLLRTAGAVNLTNEDFLPYDDRIKAQAKRIRSKNGRSDQEVYEDCKRGMVNELGIAKPLSAIIADTYDYDLIYTIDTKPIELEIKSNHGLGTHFVYNKNGMFRGINLAHFLNDTTTPYLITASHKEVGDRWVVTSHYIFHRDAFGHAVKNPPGSKMEYELEYEVAIKHNLCIKI